MARVRFPVAELNSSFNADKSLGGDLNFSFNVDKSLVVDNNSSFKGVESLDVIDHEHIS